MARSTFSQTYGPWAVVTGASSGIGTAFADELGRRGLDLVLVARNAERLDAVARDVRQRHGVRALTVQADLAAPGFLDDLRAATDALDVGLVVSNAGAVSGGALLRVPAEDLTAKARLNVLAHLEIARHYAERLVERGRGGLLLVSSTMALQAVPYAANYSGAKAYILNFGEALNAELRPTGVHATVLLPGPTDTPSVQPGRDDFDFSNAPMSFQTPEAVVREGLRALERNRPSHVSGTVNRVMAGVGKRVLSRRASTAMWGALMRRMTLPARV